MCTGQCPSGACATHAHTAGKSAPSRWWIYWERSGFWESVRLLAGEIVEAEQAGEDALDGPLAAVRDALLLGRRGVAAGCCLLQCLGRPSAAPCSRVVSG